MTTTGITQNINGHTFTTDHQPGRVEFDFSQHPVAMETLAEIIKDIQAGYEFGSTPDAVTGERVNWATA
ncbi:hypothetical protein QP892_03790 [Corynebacterium pseudodiphtheriticum]|uniref:hypothetical protein n=1 Tax=Corynebacterium pseudodiphtheriticum TaxID=37637 RepID=UPI00254CBA09|nr:hypothetical protein [Corynebacterium pseudodiphtheriticum]MDK8717640.1 hypothetical protein [Corynebacterium pseudodiphtheriticum]